MLLITFSLLATFFISYVISHLYIAFFLYSSYSDSFSELKNITKSIFSFIFGLSNVVLMAIVLEIADVDDFEIRHLYWNVILIFFILIMFYILPYYFFKTILIKGSDAPKFKYFLLVILYISYLLFANKFLYFFKERDFRFFTFYLKTEAMMEYLGLLSILLSSIVSGYCSTHCILNFLVYPWFETYLERLVAHCEKETKNLKRLIGNEDEQMNTYSYNVNTTESSISDDGSSGSTPNYTENNSDCITIKTKSTRFINNDEHEYKLYSSSKPSSSLNRQKTEEELKYLKKEYEMQMKMLKGKEIMKKEVIFEKLRNCNLYYGVVYAIQFVCGKILACYCIYRIVMTVKNLLFTNYHDINVMLREELLNIVDVSLKFALHLFDVELQNIYYTLIEQYFSLITVGSIIIVNIRSFLNTILFIYTKTMKAYDTKIDKKVQVVFLAYFVGLFYVCSSIFLIFNVPKTYRTEIVRIYGDLDYSMLKYLYDKYFFWTVVTSGFIEVLQMLISV